MGSLQTRSQQVALLISNRWKGFAVALIIAAAATFLSEHYRAPTMLFALLIGLAVSFLSEQDSLRIGLSFSAKTLLRLGVGLLGIQLSFDQVQGLGGVSVAAIFVMVLATLAVGILLSFLSKRRVAYGILSGGAVAICGASAALAFSSVLPPHPQRQNDTLFVVISVTVLSTVAMVLYPILFNGLGYSELQTGFMIGATIHDVAQVVGAGYSVSDEAGLIATLVKMLRVASLPILVFAVHFIFKNSQQTKTAFPWFLIVFTALAVLRSVAPIPDQVIAAIAEVSRWMLVTAIAALGLQTDLGAVLRVHPALLIILVLETLFILGLGMVFAGQYLT